MRENGAVDGGPFLRRDIAERLVAVDHLGGLVDRRAEQRGDALALEVEHRKKAQREVVLREQAGLRKIVVWRGGGARGRRLQVMGRQERHVSALPSIAKELRATS